MVTQRTAIRVLVGVLVLCGFWYAGWVFGNRTLHDHEVILDPSSRVAYCVALKMTSSDKRIVADSLMRPSDPVLIGRLMPVILSGLPSEEKKEAGRAIEERDRLHNRTRQIIYRNAEACRFDELQLGGHPEALADLVVSWLQYDEAFNAMLAEATTRVPDALARLDSNHARSNPYATLK